MNLEDIFKVDDSGIWIVSVSLAWDETKSKTVEITDHLTTTDAEALAIGILWQDHADEIIAHIKMEE